MAAFLRIVGQLGGQIQFIVARLGSAMPDTEKSRHDTQTLVALSAMPSLIPDRALTL